MNRTVAFAVSIMLAAVATPVVAQPTAPIPVAVVVSIPTPSSITRPMIEQGIQKSLPTYRAVPGLLRKYFTIGTKDFGGVYLFANRATAEGFFNEAWNERVLKTYGAPANITHFEVPVVLDNAAIPATAQAK